MVRGVFLIFYYGDRGVLGKSAAYFLKIVELCLTTILLVSKKLFSKVPRSVCTFYARVVSIASHRRTRITCTVSRAARFVSLILINRRTQKSEFADVDPLSHLSSGATNAMAGNCNATSR